MHVSKQTHITVFVRTRFLCNQVFMTQRAKRTSAVVFPALMAVLTYSKAIACTAAQSVLVKAGHIIQQRPGMLVLVPLV